jgi:hypothetical protein
MTDQRVEMWSPGSPEETICQEEKRGQALVAHTCNPSYSGGRDKED